MLGPLHGGGSCLVSESFRFRRTRTLPQGHEDTVTGSCFCEQVTFQVELPTLFCGHCHCSMCRRPHGASFVTWTGVPVNQLSITRGKEHLRVYQSSSHGYRQFCELCGTQLFCWHEQEDGTPSRSMNFPLASLHGDIDKQPEAHYFYDSRATWTNVDDALPKLGGATGVEPLGADHHTTRGST